MVRNHQPVYISLARKRSSLDITIVSQGPDVVALVLRKVSWTWNLMGDSGGPWRGSQYVVQRVCMFCFFFATFGCCADVFSLCLFEHGSSIRPQPFGWPDPRWLRLARWVWCRNMLLSAAMLKLDVHTKIDAPMEIIELDFEKSIEIQGSNGKKKPGWLGSCSASGFPTLAQP